VDDTPGKIGFTAKKVSGGCYALPTRHQTGNALQKFIKTVNQSLKHKVNRCVLSLRLNECKLSSSRTAVSRLFHTTGRAGEVVWAAACVDCEHHGLCTQQAVIVAPNVLDYFETVV